MAKKYDKQFKEDALQYRKDHPNLTVLAVYRNLGISAPTFYHWQKQAKQNDSEIDHIGSGNYASEVESEISVKQVLKELNVSTSGYYNWKKRKPSKQVRCQEKTREAIMEIHEESYKIYGDPKITEVLPTKGHKIAQRTVSKYMNEEGINSHYIKPYTTTTRNSDFSVELKKFLIQIFPQINQVQHGVVILPIFGHKLDLFISQVSWIFIHKKSFLGNYWTHFIVMAFYLVSKKRKEIEH